jgi:hypothetical protein
VRAEKGRLKVGRDCSVEVFLGELVEITSYCNACVVDEDVDRAEYGFDSLNQVGDRFRV